MVPVTVLARNVKSEATIYDTRLWPKPARQAKEELWGRVLLECMGIRMHEGMVVP